MKAPEPVRHCEICGKRLFRRSTAFHIYATRRFCSRACAGKANSAATMERRAGEMKICEVCGEEFGKPAGLSWSNWQKRKCCGHACRQVKAHAARRGPYAVREDDDTCACGNPATTRIYFAQGTSGGVFSAGYLRVCADCRDLALESDPDVSLTPVQSRYPERLWPSDDIEYPYTPPHGGFARRRAYHD